MVQVFEFNYELCHWERQCDRDWDGDSKVAVINGTHRALERDRAMQKNREREKERKREGKRRKRESESW